MPLNMEDLVLSDCELLVMKAIWASEDPLSVQDITERVNSAYGRNWKQQTVSVFLGRIVKKNLLTSKRKGRLFFYYPTVSEEAYRNLEIRKCMDYWGDGKADVFFAAFAEACELTDDDKQKIRGILRGLDQ